MTWQLPLPQYCWTTTCWRIRRIWTCLPFLETTILGFWTTSCSQTRSPPHQRQSCLLPDRQTRSEGKARTYLRQHNKSQLSQTRLPHPVLNLRSKIMADQLEHGRPASMMFMDMALCNRSNNSALPAIQLRVSSIRQREDISRPTICPWRWSSPSNAHDNHLHKTKLLLWLRREAAVFLRIKDNHRCKGCPLAHH